MRAKRIKITKDQMANYLGLPGESIVYRMSYDFDTDCLQVIIRNPKFDHIREGEVLPIVPHQEVQTYSYEARLIALERIAGLRP